MPLKKQNPLVFGWHSSLSQPVPNLAAILQLKLKLANWGRELKEEATLNFARLRVPVRWLSVRRIDVESVAVLKATKEKENTAPGR